MKMFDFSRNLLLTAFASCAFVAAAPALAQETPSAVPGVEIIDSVQVKDLMSKGVKMYDVRVPGDYAEAHIKGAISLPYT
ncbi:MAG: rhodanese-like domain-containing protein, partial [Rhodocyclaceae bacterium]|nr:rhodanese-like domain-containing protein [Rhodocyclaceae bacterium]